MGEVRFMISEAAKQVQVESHVLRYWEEELGLEIGRTDMGHRYYTEEDIQLFLCIQKLKNEGMLLRDLKPLIPELKKTRKRLNETKAEAHSPSCEQNKEDSSVKSARPSDSHKVSDKPADAGKMLSNASSDPKKDAKESSHPAPDSPESRPALASSEADVIPITQLEQVRSLIGDVLTDVVTANNEVLKKDISRKVTTDVLREMDFLFQANERREEEHYRKLDCLIRQQQANRRETAKETPIGKLRKLFT